jgi:high affinity Mn2+ porin
MTGTVPTAPARRSQPFVRLFVLAAAFAMLLTTSPALAQADNVAGEGESDKAFAPPKPCTLYQADDKKEENSKDKEKNGDKEDKDSKEWKLRTIWQALAAHWCALCGRPYCPPYHDKDDKKDENAKDKEKNGDDKDKDKKEEMQKILPLVAEGTMTVEQALAKLAEKTDDDKDKEDKDKEDKDKEEEDKLKLLPEGWNFHAQTTLIPNFQPGFGALYSGPNSLGTAADREGTITADVFLGAPLWQGAELHTDVLLWQGFGLSNSFGLENFPDADAYKAGTVTPRFMLSNFFVRQIIGFGGEQENVADGPFTLPGKEDVSRLTVTVGRFNMAQFFDTNTYNHDPHTQFMSWSSTMLTWDYPADTIGFTTGIVLELNQPDWTVRYGWSQLPSIPNGFTSDDRIFMWPVEPGEITSDGEFWKQWGMITELERRWKIAEHPGAIRLQAWLDHGYLASYNAATPLLLAHPPPADTPQGVEITIPAAAFAFRYKYGFGLDWEQEIATNVGLFSRLGWQDGHVAAAVYTDADWTAQLGVSVKGAAWHRPGDTFGLEGNLVGASSEQQAFLKAGGTGILNGDGNLTYACEKSLETYYDFALGKNLHLSIDYQFFADLAFNRDRGPVSVFAGRLHWDY